MSIYTKLEDIQKLSQAWEHVKKNKPAAGVDNISWDMFDRNRKMEIKQLNLELLDNNYSCLPVRIVTIYKNEKARDIALYCMRDKVVQQSIATELNKIYEPLFPKCAYAYRPDKSALQAIDEIEQAIQKQKYQYVLKLDIHHFFDNIVHKLLLSKLSQRIKEDDVLSLIMASCTVQSMEEDGCLKEKKVGIYQGSSLAPILSNIYLMECDIQMLKQDAFYIRYSDDMVVLAETKEKLEEILQLIKVQLEIVGLELNDKKTVLTNVSDGFDFLGYHFGPDGKSIPAKAEANLESRLEGMWLTERTLSLTDKLQKGAEILGGWEQYFREKRKASSIYEIAVVFYMAQNKEYDINNLKNARYEIHNANKELCVYLSKIWQRNNITDMACYEYEDYYQIADKDMHILIDETYCKELIDNFMSYLESNNKDNLESIMQVYSDVGCYNKASAVMDMIKEFEKNSENRKKPIIQLELDQDGAVKKIHLSTEQIQTYMEHFVGREDAYVLENLEKGNRRVCESVLEPLTEDVVKNHLRGEITAGTFVMRNNSTAKFLVVDIDVSKKIILSLEKTGETLNTYLQKAAECAWHLTEVLRKMGITAYVENSGYRGYHIWILFSEWIQVRYINAFQDIIENSMGDIDSSLTMEFFPNKSKARQGKMGQAIKLPYGFHIKTMRQSSFLEDDFTPVSDPGRYIMDMASYSIVALKRIIGTYQSSNLNNPEQHENDIKCSVVDEDLSEFGEFSDSIMVVLKKCNLMRYLCQKARKTGYLTHFERLSLLYVFGHMGDEGGEFLHKVMSFTLNYQYRITQKFILKVPAKPISCLKLRDQYQKITAEYGCNCIFTNTKNCYPSPVLHAIKSGTDDDMAVTLPTSRNMSKEKESKVCEEININKKVQVITGRILDLKKQKRALDKNIAKNEKELEKIFDEAGIDCLEVEFGMLVRRKKEDGYEWVVEI